MPKEKIQPNNPDEQFLSMARQRLRQIEQLEMTDEEKELTMHLINEAQAFEKDKKPANALKVYRELMDFLESIKSNLKIPLSERWKEKWDWNIGKRLILDWSKLERIFSKDNIESPEFSPDGESYVYKVKGPAGESLIKDGATLWNRSFPHIFFNTHRISPDGKSILIDFKTVEGKVGLAVNGEIWPQNYDRMDAAFSPDGKSVIAHGEDQVIDHMEKQSDGTEIPVYRTVKSALIKDKEIIMQSDSDMFQGPKLSPDNLNYACGVIDANDFGVIVNGKKWEHHFFECGYTVFSPDSKKVAVIYLQQPEGYSVAENDKLIWKNHYEDCNCGPVYSPDGKKIAIGAMFHPADNEYMIVENDRPIWTHGFDSIEEIIYSPDSKNIAAIVHDAIFARAIYINDTKVIGGDMQINTMAWSPDGKKIMYVYYEPEEKKYYRTVINVEQYLD